MGAETIVVAAGPGRSSWQTLAWAVAEATGTGQRLLICHACAPGSLLGQHQQTTPIGRLRAIDPALAWLVSAARNALGGRVELTIHGGHPGRALVHAVAPHGLLVTGPPRHTGWTSGQSITHYVTRHASRPVVIVRPAWRPPGAAFGGHVVVGVDGSPGSRAALGFAFPWASAHGRPLAAVHVTPHDDEDIWFDERMLETHFVAEPPGLHLLAAETDAWRAEYPEVMVKRALFAGRPADGLLRAAAGASLLVIGGSRRTPATWAFRGSLVHRLVDRAGCPLSVVPTAARLGTPAATVPPGARRPIGGWWPEDRRPVAARAAGGTDRSRVLR